MGSPSARSKDDLADEAIKKRQQDEKKALEKNGVTDKQRANFHKANKKVKGDKKDFNKKMGKKLGQAKSPIAFLLGAIIIGIMKLIKNKKSGKELDKLKDLFKQTVQLNKKDQGLKQDKKELTEQKTKLNHDLKNPNLSPEDKASKEKQLENTDKELNDVNNQLGDVQKDLEKIENEVGKLGLSKEDKAFEDLIDKSKNIPEKDGKTATAEDTDKLTSAAEKEVTDMDEETFDQVEGDLKELVDQIDNDTAPTPSDPKPSSSTDDKEEAENDLAGGKEDKSVTNTLDSQTERGTDLKSDAQNANANQTSNMSNGMGGSMG